MRDEVRQAFINARTTQAVHDLLSVWYSPSREWPASPARETLTDLIAAGARD
jgi:hypothetical protein